MERIDTDRGTNVSYWFAHSPGLNPRAVQLRVSINFITDLQHALQGMCCRWKSNTVTSARKWRHFLTYLTEAAFPNRSQYLEVVEVDWKDRKIRCYCKVKSQTKKLQVKEEETNKRSDWMKLIRRTLRPERHKNSIPGTRIFFCSPAF